MCESICMKYKNAGRKAMLWIFDTVSDSISSTIGCNSGIHVNQSLNSGIHKEQSCTAGNINAELMPDSEKASYAPALVVWK